MKAQTTKPGNAQQDVEHPTENPHQVTVNFHKTKLNCIIEPNGTVLVSIKPICDAIGLNVDSAWSSIKNDEILGHVHAVRQGRDSKNRKNLMTYLPIQHVHGWLFGIQTSKVSANSKPKLLQFKRECYQVLFDHFYGRYRVYEENLEQKRNLINQLLGAQQERQEVNARIQSIKKRLDEISALELSGQLSLNVKGGRS